MTGESPVEMRPLSELVVDGEISYGIVQPGHDVSDGVPMLRVKDLHEGSIDSSAPLRVGPDISQRHRRTVLVGGELLVSLVGTVGMTAVVPAALAGWNVARALAVVKPREVTAEWLHYCFGTPQVKNAVSAALNTTVQATLNLSDLKSLPIPVPPAAEREAICQLLGALDDKIAANAQLISGADRLSRVTFESILGDEAVPLSSVARFINGKAFTKDATGTGRVVIRIAELNSGLGGSTVYNDLDVPDEHVARPGDLLFAWSGSLTVHRWFRPEAIVNQHIFKVIPTNGYPLWCVNGLLRRKLEHFRDIAANKATTMGHIQRRHLDAEVSVPTRAQIERNDEVMTGLWQRALAAEVESLRLEQLRDTLLPLLMSGKIRVKDAEHLVSEAV